MDWETIFIPDTPILETFIRGSIMYISIFIILRIVLRRQTGTLGMGDLILVTLLADASQNGLADDYRSVPNGILLVGTIVFWNYAFDWLSFRSKWFSRLLQPPAMHLIKNGEFLYGNMRRELITKDELMTQLREQGLDDVSKVKEAYIEGDGRISVIEHEQKRHDKMERRGG